MVKVGGIENVNCLGNALGGSGTAGGRWGIKTKVPASYSGFGPSMRHSEGKAGVLTSYLNRYVTARESRIAREATAPQRQLATD